MKNLIINIFRFFGFSIKKYNAKDYDLREKYFISHKLYNKYRSFTMIPELVFHDNLMLANDFSKIEGVVVECGVWKGGMMAAMAEICGSEKTYYLFDSFEGLPEASLLDGGDAVSWQNNKSGEHYFDNCSADVNFAQEAIRMSGAKHVHIVKGWFSETLIKTEIRNISILRLDGDWYDSTMDCLLHLYPKVVEGGIIILDDYYFWEGCSRAVHDYLSSIKSSDKIHKTANGVAYIIKGEIINRPW